MSKPMHETSMNTTTAQQSGPTAPPPSDAYSLFIAAFGEIVNLGEPQWVISQLSREFEEGLLNRQSVLRILTRCKDAMNRTTEIDARRLQAAGGDNCPRCGTPNYEDGEGITTICACRTNDPPPAGGFVVDEMPRHPEPVAERVGDMGEGTKLQLFREDDGDFIVSVMPSGHRIPDLQVQFCVPGSGGGKSSKTWDALCALHFAMHQDAHPDFAAAPAAQVSPLSGGVDGEAFTALLDTLCEIAGKCGVDQAQVGHSDAWKQEYNAAYQAVIDAALQSVWPGQKGEDSLRLDFLDRPFISVLGCEPDVPTVEVNLDRYGAAGEYSGPNIRAAIDAARADAATQPPAGTVGAVREESNNG